MRKPSSLSLIVIAVASGAAALWAEEIGVLLLLLMVIIPFFFKQPIKKVERIDGFSQQLEKLTTFSKANLLVLSAAFLIPHILFFFSSGTRSDGLFPVIISNVVTGGFLAFGVAALIVFSRIIRKAVKNNAHHFYDVRTLDCIYLLACSIVANFVLQTVGQGFSLGAAAVGSLLGLIGLLIARIPGEVR